jgi:hypothetical protein
MKGVVMVVDLIDKSIPFTSVKVEGWEGTWARLT